MAQCGNGARFARFVRLKGLTNKRDIRVSTANGRMVLTVTDDDLVRVNMGEPNFGPSAVPFRANKAEKTYICAPPSRQSYAAWCRWEIRIA